MTMTWTRSKTRAARADVDNAKFDALFEQHWQRICEVLYRLVGDWAEAEDLALETFVRLYEHPPANAQHLGGWLYRVSTNLGLNALRARKRRQFYEAQAAQESFDGKAPDPASILEQAQERQKVQLVLAQMKTRSALLLLLRYSNFSYAEIANALEIPPGSVGTLLARAEQEFSKKYMSLL